MILLIVKPSEPTSGGTQLESKCVPRMGEQIFFRGESYGVAAVKWFFDVTGIPVYKNIPTPFVRIMLMNQ